MGTKYRQDENLAFLPFCTEDELKVLARYLTHDKDGTQRITSELLERDEFKRLKGQPDQYRRSWQLIAGELQHFGGDTIVNLVRSGGVLYQEILTDVCGRMKVKFNKKNSAYDIENALLEKLVADSWEKMGAQQRAALLDSVGLDEKLSSAAGLVALQALLQTGRFASFQISAIVAGVIADMFAGNSLAVVAGGGLGRVAGFAAGPFGIAISAALMVPAISGVAYRVTVPAVIQVAYMRRACEKRQEF
ncbi:DUF3944 domain-containing protein [Paraburkholderia sp. SIMBA_049]